ncbi:hypothetical protein SBA4_1730013 [Candidatus Sulfopaludibacter sp. SbA4]|nr:hypothetical protein SBA4_1730013 [Candidatus Sulfopaludibacter sp. SbA4]
MRASGNATGMGDSVGETRPRQAQACERQGKHGKCSQPHGFIHNPSFGTGPLLNLFYPLAHINDIPVASRGRYRVWSNSMEKRRYRIRARSLGVS